jgi:hypothetical protein
MRARWFARALFRGDAWRAPRPIAVPRSAPQAGSCRIRVGGDELGADRVVQIAARGEGAFAGERGA